MIECLGESLVFLSLHIFLFYYVWALGRCSASRILGEKNAWKFLWRHLFTYFSFQQRKKALSILKACALRYKELIWNTKYLLCLGEQREGRRWNSQSPVASHFSQCAGDLSKPRMAREHVQISSILHQERKISLTMWFQTFSIVS